ncbi:MAG: hypothetical protein HY753_03230, partial [Nitrospirae bacterium]|nr:hypothetical protein [Nitrospirota bacterium]
MEFETVGAVRSTAKFEGIFSSSDGTVIAEYIARMSFYFGKNIVKMDFTIKNPKAAKHPGGLWDLGDPGSVFFKDLSMQVSLKSTSKTDIMWKTQLNNSFNSANSNNLIIYQDSSGVENWDSPVHVNKDGLVKNRFRGYRVTSDRIIEEGHRASPSVAIRSGEKVITAAIQNFWQNFPKSLEVKNNAIVIRLFPEQYDDMFELQGGEQKTHSVYIHFGSGVEEPEHLDWVQSPLVVRAPSEWYSRSMALGYISPFGKDKNPEYQKLVNNAIEGDSNFFLLREKIDEYGWRHFGDVYANHEIVSYKGSSLLF